MVTIEASCTNVSSRDVVVTSLEPIRVLASEGGTLRVPGVASCITNGEMYYDAGRIHPFTADPPPGSRPPIKGARLANESIALRHPTVASWWNIGLFSGYDREGVVLGYLENTRALGLVLAARTAENEIAFLSESVYAPPITLGPGRSIGSNRFMLNVAASPYAALEEYADAVGTVQNARTRSIVNGWCSWFYTLAEVSEDEVLRNTAFAARHLRPFGLEYIQIDEGYQRAHGDWEGNERFPHGMQWLAERIKEYGFKAGLWISPYVISERTDVFRRHPDWLVQRRDGSLQRIGNWENENSPEALSEVTKRYCLDITHPQAADWLRDLFETIARRWGFEMIKIDFMAWSILAAERFRDPTLSSAEVYRKGLEIMRAAAGEGCHILECGPGNTTVGLIDSMRIEADINYGYAGAAWKQYFQDPACSAAAAAKRYYFHRRTWVNDVDHVCIDLLTVQQAEAAATSIALSGGNMISGDRLVDLDPVKLEILKRSRRRTARPPFPSISSMPTFLRRSCCMSNGRSLHGPSSRSSTRSLRRGRATLPLEPARAGSGQDLSRVRLLETAVHRRGHERAQREGRPRQRHPARASCCDRHAAAPVDEPACHTGSDRDRGPAVERNRAQLERNLDRPAAERARRFRVCPRRPSMDVGRKHVLLRDYAGYSLKLVDSNVLRVHVRFENESRVPWKIDFDDFFG